jgi:RNA polymerase sigma-70 factor (ECF subfamily)
MGRRQQFEAMYVEQGPALRTFVHRRIGSAVADDVVAEVFLAAWRRYDEVPSDPLPWLFGIARGVLANQRRGQRRAASLYERLVTSTTPQDLEPRHEARVDLSPVLQACASLGSRDQEVLLLVAWDGLDRAQAARVLGISTAQFAVRLHRARRRLRRAVDAGPLRITPTDSPSPSEVS